MKMITLIPKKGIQQQETLILLTYWFINSKSNLKAFDALQELKNNLGDKNLRIVCLNPYNSIEDIKLYSEKLPYKFEFDYDHKQSARFYQISSFPTFILMEKSGKILHRHHGISEENTLFEIEKIIKTSRQNTFPELTVKAHRVQYEQFCNQAIVKEPKD